MYPFIFSISVIVSHAAILYVHVHAFDALKLHGFSRYGVNPLSQLQPLFIQGPIFISFFLAVRYESPSVLQYLVETIHLIFDYFHDFPNFKLCFIF